MTGMGAEPLHHLGHSAATQRTQRGQTVKPRARRENSGTVENGSGRSSWIRYAACAPIAAYIASALATIASPLSYGTLSVLCASVAQESARSTQPVPILGRGSSPQPEGAIDMDPGTVLMCKINSISDWVEGSAVNVSCLQADDQRVVASLSQGVGESVKSDPTLIIGRNHDALCLAQAETAAPRRRSRGVPRQRSRSPRCALQPIALDIPAHPA